jgi:hypothetical protein
MPDGGRLTHGSDPCVYLKQFGGEAFVFMVVEFLSSEFQLASAWL